MALHHASTSKKVVWNTVFNAIGRFGSMLLSLFLTPYIFNTIKPDAYGLYALLFVVTDFAALLDMGIATAYMKHIAEFHAKGDDARTNQVINTGLLFSAVFSLVFVAAGWAMTDRVLTWVNCDLPEGRFAFRAVLAIFATNYTLLIFRAILNGLLRLDLLHGTQLTSAVVSAVCTVVLLEQGWGLKGLVISRLLMAVVSSAGFVFFSRRVLPSMRLGLRWCSGRMFKRLLNFGWKIQVAVVSEIVNFHVDKLLLGTILRQTKLVAFYDIGARISNVIRTVSFMLLGAIEAASAELFAQDSDDALAELYLRASRYLVAIIAPLCVFVLLFAEHVVYFYLGEPAPDAVEGYIAIAQAARYLSVAGGALLLVGVAKSVARGMGVLGPEVRAAVCLLVFNASLSLVLVLEYGFVGALRGTLVASVLSYAYYMYEFHRRIPFSFLALVRRAYLPAAISCAAASGLGWWVCGQITRTQLPSGRLGYGIVCAATGAAFIACYAVAAFACRFITFADVSSVLRALRSTAPKNQPRS